MDINVYEKKPEPEANKEYKIINVEQQKGQFGEYIRVTLEDSEKKQYSSALWIKDTVSSTSKAGAFALALGTNPETWINKYIKVISWTPKNRVIIEIPKGIDIKTDTKKVK
jgi:hypothetical protein